ncbi:MAG: hypothetical protein RL375_3100 [Pseudomonadota bacterium]|jgi:uncharacterized protein YdhG (YjbR/CyaY superfamily)
MQSSATPPQSIDDYIAGQPPQVQAKLQAIRARLRSLAPAAQERIAYGIPTVTLGKNVFHYAAFKAHIGLYPGAAAIEAFAAALAGYRTSKGAIQIPLDQDVPLALIDELLHFNLEALASRPEARRASRRSGEASAMPPRSAAHNVTADRAGPAAQPSFDGGCACGQVRFRLLDRPMFVHCCHCTRCQRENGAPFAHHAMVEYTHFEVVQGEPAFVLVPTDSGGKHWIARCPNCQTAMWNEHGTRQAITRYVRVGTLDEPAALPPQAHIYVKSKQPWLLLGDQLPQFKGYYDAAKAWPAESLARYEAAKTLRAQEAKASRGTRAKKAV